MDMNERITRALDDMTPDHAAKVRMHERLMADAKAARPSPLRPGRRRLGIALAVTVLFCATVFAATQLPQYVNWQGEPVATPDFFSGFSGEEIELMEERSQWALHASKFIPAATSSERWVAYRILPDGTVDESLWNKKAIHRTLDSFEALNAAIRAEGVLLLLEQLPPGYAFEFAQATYLLPRDLSSVLLSEEQVADDVMLRCYAMLPEDQFLTEYTLALAKGQQHLRISGTLHRSTVDTPEYIPLVENNTARPIAIEGMDKAVIVDGELAAWANHPAMTTRSLETRYRKMLIAPGDRGSRPWEYLRIMDRIDRDDPSFFWLWSTYNIFSANALPENDLIALANTFH